MRRVLTVIGSALTALVMLAQPAFAGPLPPHGERGAKAICNNSHMGMGVIHTLDGNYSGGNYDVALKPIRSDGALYCTSTLGWPHAGAAYIPPGYNFYIYGPVHANTFLRSIGGGFSGNWFWPNNLNAVYWIRICKIRSDNTHLCDFQ